MNSQKTKLTFYSETLPGHLENRLSANLKKQYNLWDETIKRQVQLYPKQILPLIHEVFQKDYCENVDIELLSTEYAVPDMKNNSTNELHSIFADLTIHIAKADIYHIECQMDDEKEMVLRVIEYDLHIALKHGVHWNSKTEKLEMKFPKSVILYLDHTQNTPDSETCRLTFADGTTYQYHVPVMKVQNYTPKDIKEKNLRILMPFLPIRFRHAITKGTSSAKEKSKNELTIMLRECMIIINQQFQNHTITEREMKDLIKLTENACKYLYGSIPEVMQEVQEIMEPFLKMDWEIIEEQKQQLKMDWEIIEEQRQKLKMDWEIIEEQRQKLEMNWEIIEKQKKTLASNKKTIDEQQQVLASNKKTIDEQQQSLASSLKTIDTQKQELVSNQKTIDEQQQVLASNKKTLDEQQQSLASSQHTIEQQKLQRDRDIQNLILTLERQGNAYFDIQMMLESVFGLTPEEAKDRLRK